MMHRSDYKPISWKAVSLEVYFDIQEDKSNSSFVMVKSSLWLERFSTTESEELFLNGEELELKKILIDEQEPSLGSYKLHENGITIYTKNNNVKLYTEVLLKPESNTHLSGLYKSGALLLTQCEPQGFRRITYFLDRPDCLTPIKTHIEAPKGSYPILLGNGNLVDEKDLGDRHVCTYNDPFPKPCYLFAIVAGPLSTIESIHTSPSGRKIKLHIYNTSENIEHCKYALRCLEEAVKWEERVYGLECDLNEYRVVGVDEFNGGAMENKGLNVFSNRYLLSDPQSTEDIDLFHVESVIAHEYFHNWTGNRVTLKNWFELSLKEGLTVFRDQQFSADLNDPDENRIINILALKNSQFREDAGPNAHAVRPETSASMSNLFTATIYQKGAQILHMICDFMGREDFIKGVRAYLKKFDGGSAEIEDLITALQDQTSLPVNDLVQWYIYAGTPEIRVRQIPDAHKGIFEIEQIPSPKSGHIIPIPLSFQVNDAQGSSLELRIESPVLRNPSSNTTFHLSQTPKSQLVFPQWPKQAQLSLNLGFAAPIILKTEDSFDSLKKRLFAETDSVNTWLLWNQIIEDHLDSLLKLGPKDLQSILVHKPISPSVKARLLDAPSPSVWIDKIANPTSLDLRLKLEAYRSFIFKNLKEDLIKFTLQREDAAQRKLANNAWFYLAEESSVENLEKLLSLWNQAPLFNDRISAFRRLAEWNHIDSNVWISEMEKRCSSSQGAYLKFLESIAVANSSETFSRIQKLSQSSQFQRRNPTHVFSLVYRFGLNSLRFHDADHQTYEWYVQFVLEMDRINPESASRCWSAFDSIGKMAPALKARANKCIYPLLKAHLSPNSKEKVESILKILESC